jgi:hypothetical protein
MKKINFIFLQLIILITYMNGEYYVSDSGNDTNPCSLEFQCNTLNEAISKVPENSVIYISKSTDNSLGYLRKSVTIISTNKENTVINKPTVNLYNVQYPVIIDTFIIFNIKNLNIKINTYSNSSKILNKDKKV